MSKQKYLTDAAKLVDQRMDALERELAERPPSTERLRASDRAAIMEGRHLAKLIRSLRLCRYGDDPYGAARDNWARGQAND